MGRERDFQAWGVMCIMWEEALRGGGALTGPRGPGRWPGKGSTFGQGDVAQRDGVLPVLERRSSVTPLSTASSCLSCSSKPRCARRRRRASSLALLTSTRRSAATRALQGPCGTGLRVGAPWHAARPPARRSGRPRRASPSSRPAWPPQQQLAAVAVHLQLQ